MTFANGLRSILRQDPDIIMVGEMRDNETAEIAIRAALTGHLVLSTIHTNDAASAITRLVDMDIEPFLISASLIGVVSQRLIRKICPNCVKEYQANNNEKRLLGIPEYENLTLKKGMGCNACHGSGYKGRIAIFEFMSLQAGHRQLIDNRATADELREYAVSQSMNTLQKAAATKVLAGISTVDELLRVAFVDE